MTEIVKDAAGAIVLGLCITICGLIGLGTPLLALAIWALHP